MAEQTVVFVDLTGSTGIFEALGNAKAAEVVTRATQWLGKMCALRGGRVIKFLGDGVLMAYDDNLAAVHAVVELQRLHNERISTWPANLKMKLKIGLARGALIEQDGESYGDAINVASGLSDLAGAEQILSSELVIQQLPAATDIQSRKLGDMDLRGRSEALPVYRVEWQQETASEHLTMPAELDSVEVKASKRSWSLEVASMDVTMKFDDDDLPAFLGRGEDAQFNISDPRVSRLHARIQRRGDSCVLEDISSYGTWVRFAGSDAVVALRRQECVLHDSGEIALGAPFDDISVPTLSFNLRR